MSARTLYRPLFASRRQRTALHDVIKYASIHAATVKTKGKAKLFLQPLILLLPIHFLCAIDPHGLCYSFCPFLTTRRLSSQFTPDDQQQQQQRHQHQPKPSSLLLKRLAPKNGQKAPRNLTIFTPSYAGGVDQASSLGIHSAPLHPRGNSKHNPHTLQPIQHRNRIQKITTAKKSNLRSPPATAAPWPTQQSEFPSPPIVPSQQRYPATTQTAKTTASILPKTPLPPPPSTAQPLSKKQQFLQPFEMLYDTLEQTRALKSTLDDQIRRSSSMMQNLQSSSALVEQLVRQQLQEMVQQHFATKLKECTARINWLEEQQQQQQQEQEQASKETPPVQSAPTEERSIKDMLTELVNRLDKLEDKMDCRP